MEHFVSRLARFLLGGLLVLFSIPSFLTSYIGSLITFILIFGFYMGVHHLISRNEDLYHKFSFSAMLFIPIVLVFLFGQEYGAIASLFYLGASFLISAVKKDLSCEVLIIPNYLLKKETHLRAVIFFPLDWYEKNYI